MRIALAFGENKSFFFMFLRKKWIRMLLKTTKNGLKYRMKTFNGKKATFHLFLCDKRTNISNIVWQTITEKVVL